MPALLHIASKELSKVRPAVWRALRVVLWSTNSGLPVLCLFAATLWVARYWYSAEFGLYEDDFTRAPRTMTADLPLLGRLLADNFSRLSEHGKIFHAPLLDFFAFLGGKLGALGTASPFRGAYLLGFSLHLLSAGLFYTLLQRIARGGSSRQPALPFPDLFALLGGLAFCLFCADTTQVWLTRSFGLQPALILLLLAFHSYLAGRKPLAYLLAGLILLVYENPFPVFLAAPLLETPAVQITAWDRRWLKATLCHIAILSIFLLATLLLRRLAGEDRASSLETTGALQTVLTHSVYGPLTSLKGMLSRPYQIARSLFGAGDPKPDVLTSLALFTPLFTCALWIAARPLCFGQRSSPISAAALRDGEGRVGWVGIARVTLFGLLALLLAYSLTFTIDPRIMDGRDSRVHLAAVFGASILIACAGLLLFSGIALLQSFLPPWHPDQRQRSSPVEGRCSVPRRCSVPLPTAHCPLPTAVIGRSLPACTASHFLLILPSALFGVYFSLLLAYGFVIQGDYALAWQMQRQFWTQLTPLIGDAGDGTLILVEPSVPRATGQIGVITWNTPRVLEQLYEFPSTWQQMPRVYRLEPGWEQTLAASDGQPLQLQINDQNSFVPETMFVTLSSTQVIFLETGEKGLSRRTAPLSLHGQDYPLQQPTVSGPPPYPSTPLYTWLVIP